MCHSRGASAAPSGVHSVRGRKAPHGPALSPWQCSPLSWSHGEPTWGSRRVLWQLTERKVWASTMFKWRKIVSVQSSASWLALYSGMEPAHTSPSLFGQGAANRGIRPGLNEGISRDSRRDVLQRGSMVKGQHPHISLRYSGSSSSIGSSSDLLDKKTQVRMPLRLCVCVHAKHFVAVLMSLILGFSGDCGLFFFNLFMNLFPVLFSTCHFLK